MSHATFVAGNYLNNKSLISKPRVSNVPIFAMFVIANPVRKFV